MRKEGTPGEHLVKPLAQNRVNYRSLLRAMFSHIFNISDDRHSANSLGNVFQYLTTFTVKKSRAFSLKFKRNFLYFCSLPFVLFLSLGTTEKGLALLSLLPPIIYFYMLIGFPWAFSFPGWAALIAFPHVTDAPVPWSSLHKVQKFKVQKDEICKSSFQIQDLFSTLPQIHFNPCGSTWLFGHYGA